MISINLPANFPTATILIILLQLIIIVSLICAWYDFNFGHTYRLMRKRDPVTRYMLNLFKE